jgi:ABC-type multidrug transport system fused ATPase/permease subunit
MNQTIIYTAEMEQNLVAVERTRQYFNNSLENINESPTASLYSAKNPEGIQDPSDSAIVFDNVCLSYNYSEGSKDISYALKKISFCIRKGEKVAFCGR